MLKYFEAYLLNSSQAFSYFHKSSCKSVCSTRGLAQTLLEQLPMSSWSWVHCREKDGEMEGTCGGDSVMPTGSKYHQDSDENKSQEVMTMSFLNLLKLTKVKNNIWMN